MTRDTSVLPFSDLWELAERRARALEQSVLLSLSEASHPVDPIALFARRNSPARFLLYSQRTGDALVGLHAQRLPVATAAVTDLPVPERLARAWRRWSADALWDGPLPPLAFAGWAFDPLGDTADERWQAFGAAQLLLPRLLYRQQGTLAFRAVQAVVRPGETPPRLPGWGPLPPATAPSAPLSTLARRELVTADDWQRMVTAALAAIERGELAKVVLARSVELSTGRRFDVEHALRVLAERYPACTLFALALGDAVFFGATPERLARVAGGTVTTVALAGSLPRLSNAADDGSSAAALWASAKDRQEHAFVVEAIRTALAPFCTHLAIPDEPIVVSMANVHHLATPITGVLADGFGVLDVAARLHPTPAVGGTPREAALAFIRAHERIPRGWYAGALGYVEGNEDGELVVALRSGIVRETEARLYAGCGIVIGSDPRTEWAEAEAKLRPMLEALTGV
ncbi:MAG: isochorismate synthase [Thermomicrobium sp.]|nr:isochorismate synthase [Thermomicrobium sp.]